MAQRLVRKICPNCKQPYEMTEAEMQALGIDLTQLERSHTWPRAPAATTANTSATKAAPGIFEIFIIDDEVRHMINQKSSTVELRKRAREMGMRTLREDGIRKVLSGMTTAEEVIAVSMGDSH